jgi:ribosome-associated protein
MFFLLWQNFFYRGSIAATDRIPAGNNPRPAYNAVCPMNSGIVVTRGVVFAVVFARPACFSSGRLYVSMVGAMIRITPSLSVPEEELDFEYVRASGPGGQNVNKVATAVRLRFDARRSPSLQEDVRRRLEKFAGRRLTAGGILVIDARRFRTQEQNRDDAFARLRELIARAAVPPKRRKATKPTRGSVERRLTRKRRKGERKTLRGKQSDSDY